MKRIAFFILSILCFTACSDDTDIEKPQIGTQIELYMPEAEKVNVYSTASTSECMIDNIWVLEFDISTNTVVNSEHIAGNQIVKNGETTQLMPQLSFEPTTGNKIVCIANSVRTAAVPVGYPYDNINNTNINIGFPPYEQYSIISPQKWWFKVGDYLPMYGEMRWNVSISEGYTCVMTRSVAKVQVKMGTSVSDVTGKFSAETVRFWGHMLPIYGFIKPETNTTGSWSDSDFFYFQQKSGATDATTTFYMYDYPSSTTNLGGSTISDNEFEIFRPNIMLRSELPNDTTYYRLDFYDPSTQKFLDIERNHHYTFTINKVRSYGYKTYAEARDHAASNIEYTIKIEDNSQSITSNGQYAVVTNIDTAYVEAGVSDATIATVRYQLPSEMTALTSHLLSVSSIAVTSGSGLTLASSMPTSFSGMSPNQNTNVIVTTTTAFATEAVITFKLGNIIHNLVVKRK